MPTVPPEDQKTAIQAWLNERWQNAQCPVCGTVGWTASDVLQIPAYGFTWQSEIRVTPVSSVMCIECGYTMFFNAIRAGIIDPADEGLASDA
ncbi:hypothetical protein [Microbacterium maritypicum]|uniref:hypothetical protein n=1 Tax=Microbacterium maritypicum TaxID=33918 RepID=UPI003806B8B2